MSCAGACAGKSTGSSNRSAQAAAKRLFPAHWPGTLFLFPVEIIVLLYRRGFPPRFNCFGDPGDGSRRGLYPLLVRVRY